VTSAVRASRRTAPADIADVARRTLERGRDHLLSLQQEEGWWKGELETNVTMDAEDLLLRQFLGILREDQKLGTGNWIRSKQREDGTWANFHGGPGELSTTVESYAALRLVGDPADAEHMRRARSFIVESGGIEASRVFTRMWLSLFGLWSWDDIPALPPEMIFLPEWFPLNIYDFACWARQTIVALTVVGAHRPVRPISFGLDELRARTTKRRPLPLSTSGGRLQLLDRFLHAYERRPIPGLRRLALRRAAEWILRRQEADGGWGGIQPPWVYSIIALHLLGYPLDHSAMRAAIDGLEGFTIVEGAGSRDVIRRLEACQSPVWDTALAVIALADAGVAPNDPALVRAVDWLLAEEIRVRGDWAVRRPALNPGGWAFEFANDNYADIDDTAEVVLALLRVDHPRPELVHAAVERGVAWSIGMQSKDGGWAAFDADNTRRLGESLPFCDFGEVIDPPSADVTAHVVEMGAIAAVMRVAPAASAEASRALRRGISWLARGQEGDGSWFGRWGANHVYGTGAVVPAAIAAGIAPSDPRIRAAVRWLERHQNADGGWGEDLRSYDDPAWRGHGASTASQTAWALLAMVAAGELANPSAERGVRWLAETQRPDGTWDEPWYTGTGFPGDFYINYHLYRLVFPVTALGRFVKESRG
jgi:squalene-hopene/tetraprenyl-beta-curcumene cyclase